MSSVFQNTQSVSHTQIEYSALLPPLFMESWVSFILNLVLLRFLLVRSSVL